MSIASATVGAAIGAALGGAIWAAIGHFTGYELGIAAWGVGALAGFGAVTGSKDGVNASTGVIAAVFAVLAILGAKYVVVYSYLQQMNVNVQSAITSFEYTDEYLKEHIAQEVIKEKQAAGQEIAWQHGTDADGATWPQDYPADVTAEATKRFDKLSPDERTAQRAVEEKKMRATIEALPKPTSLSNQWDAFKSTFDLMDLLWIGLAIASAHRIGSSRQA